VAEFASPHELLQRPASLLSSLVEELGPETAAAMRRAAEQACEAARSVGSAAPAVIVDSDGGSELPRKAL
jgi:hypothetical protein